MPLDLPKEVEDFLRKPNAAVIAAVRPDGFPMTVATWYDWVDGRVLVNMHAKRRRLAWMRQNPKVSLTFFDQDWYRHVSLYGLVESIDDDVDLADIDRLARRYTAQPFGSRSQERVSAWIAPVGWHGWDPKGELVRRPR
ncbi:MAG TPA: pyridoxamine 5'-phosphate oxidase family protein [Candidatus Dormibacteraeota bacterium]|nr:pyridoxamine 5'-phosphate oxidase family protein [Candidatus Dormibacteraeota bacterium]